MAWKYITYNSLKSCFGKIFVIFWVIFETLSLLVKTFKMEKLEYEFKNMIFETKNNEELVIQNF